MQALVQFQMTIPNGNGVPSPVDKSSDTWWDDVQAMEADDLAQAAITDVLDMPHTRSQNLGNGYDVTTLYDSGDLTPVRAGTRQLHHRKLAIQAFNGIDPHPDLVLAHRDGGTGKNGRTIKIPTPNGGILRMPMSYDCFTNYDKANGRIVYKDHVLVPSEDFAADFGQQISYFNGSLDGATEGYNGPGYPSREVVKACAWLAETFGYKGPRWDNMKSLDPELIHQIVKAAGWKWGMGEHWTSDIGALYWAIFGTQINGGTGVADYPFFFEMRNMSNGPADPKKYYRMSQLAYSGFWQHAPMNSTLFPNNHDLDKQGTVIEFNLPLCYAMIFCLPGLPCVYARDWLPKPLGRGLKPQITGFGWFRYFFAQGAYTKRWADDNVWAFTRGGTDLSPGCLAVFNQDEWKTDGYWIDVQTHFRNVWLHEYSGHEKNNFYVDGNGKVRVHVKCNVDGSGYTLLAPDGYQGRKVATNSKPAVHSFEAAPDLLLPMAKPEGVLTMPIWCGANTPIYLDKKYGDANCEVTDRDGNAIIPRGNWAGETKRHGWHNLRCFSRSGSLEAYKVQATYRATRTIQKGE